MMELRALYSCMLLNFHLNSTAILLTSVEARLYKKHTHGDWAPHGTNFGTYMASHAERHIFGANIIHILSIE